MNRILDCLLLLYNKPMESLFNPDVATSLQYLTFPLEVIGLALALIEVRFPEMATYLTQRIEALSAPIEQLRSDRPNNESLMHQSLNALLSRVLTFGYFVLTAIYVVRLLYLLLSDGLGEGWLLGFFISYLVSAIFMTIALVILGLMMYFLVVGGSDFARRFVAGRAVGTLGIIIAGVGLLGECYQLITQLVH